MTYTINGKEWTEFDINKRCAELMVVEVKISIDQKHWLLPSSIKNNGGYNPYDPCNNPADTDSIIDKCWNELSLYVDCDGDKVTYETFSDAAFKPLSTKQQFIMDKNKCTKLVAACICLIEINEGKS